MHALVVLLGVHGVDWGAGQCGVDVLSGGGAWRRGPFLLLVFCVLVRGGCRGYGAGLHGVVGFLRFRGLLVGVWARGPG